MPPTSIHFSDSKKLKSPMTAPSTLGTGSAANPPFGPAAVPYPQGSFNLYSFFYPHPFLFLFMPQNNPGSVGYNTFQMMQLQAQAPGTL